MNHPTPEELFDAAREGSPGSFAKHIDNCTECRTAYQRLRVGASLLDDASEEPALDDIRWDRIDAAIAAEGERVAAGIRSGSIRAPRQWGSYAMGGLALAAAAAAVVYVRTNHVAEQPSPVAHHVAPAPAPRFEGAVLLAAGGASQTPAGSSVAVRMSSGTSMGEGARVVTTSAGRAVFAVQPSVALDVRPGSDVTLTALRDGRAEVTLAQGEVAIDREGDNGSVTVRAGRWQIGVEGDVVTRVESHVVRVVVLSGRTSSEADGVSRMQFTGPIVLELPDVGASHPLQGEASDPSRIELSVLRSAGTMWALPALDPAATLTVLGHGALPSSLEAIRVTEPVTLQARLGRMVMTLEVGSGRVLEWHNTTVVAAAQPTVRHAQQAAPSVIQSPEPEGRELTRAEINAVSGRLGARVAHCVSTCVEQNVCQRDARGMIEFTIGADGRVSFASAPPSVAGAQRCIANEAAGVRGPAAGGTSTFQLPIR